MRRTYPYLQDAYKYNSDKEFEKRNFLSKIDKFVNQRQYVRMTLLNWSEEPIKEIQGIITSGSMSKDGSSAVRTTCNFSCSINYGDNDILDIESDFSINKKIFIEIGVKNDSDEYLEYPILWFPQGVFFIGGCSYSSNTNSAVVLNLSLKDKMAGLNGDIGGKFPIATSLDMVDTQLPDGSYAQQKVPIYSMIQEMVNHYGNEPLANIVIEDIPARARQIVKWNGENPLYLTKLPNQYDSENDNNEYSYFFSLQEPEVQTIIGEDGNPQTYGYITFNNGDDVGYVLTDFVYPDELTVNGGTTITSALDAIKNKLGNYEYFYDEMGIFHFREIKNYLNTTQGKLVLDELSENQYLVELDNSKSVYTFDSNVNINSINATPNFANIRNDFVVTGLRQSADKETSAMIMYHLAIEDKPELVTENASLNNGEPYYSAWGLHGLEDDDDQTLVFYYQEDTGYTVGSFVTFTGGALPDVGNNNSIYQADGAFWRWDDDNNVYKKLYLRDDNGNETDVVYYNGLNRYKDGKEVPDSGCYYATDWRAHLYLVGANAEVHGTDEGYYYQELKAYWPQVYDFLNHRFYSEVPKGKSTGSEVVDDVVNEHTEWRTLTDGNYYLDFINASSSTIGKYGVDVIGRRPEVISKDDDINCLFQPEIPDVNFLNIDDVELNSTSSTMIHTYTTLAEQRQECIDLGQPYTQVGSEIYDNLVLGGYHNGAYDEIKYQLLLHTYYARTLSITGLPAFYLQPNSRVTVKEESTNTYGDFITKNISFSLGAGSLMTTTLNEAIERI